MASEGCPYPGSGGRFIIDQVFLPLELKVALRTAVTLHDMAEESRRLAHQWEKEGVAREDIQNRLRLAATFERSRDREWKKLWSFYGAKPPARLRFEDLDIREARVRALSPATANPQASTDDGPYCFQGGKYFIVRSLLTPELKQILLEAERFHAEAKESWKLVDQWEQMGQEMILVDGRRKIAESSEVLRDVMVARLWTFKNLMPPGRVRFDQLRIVG